jgi:hypothetical protein
MLAALILRGRPVAGSTSDGNRAFYQEFARAYDLARASGNAKNLILEANPHLTLSQYREYLKRARAFGYVQSPSRYPAPQPAPRLSATARRTTPRSTVPDGLDEDMRRWLADARAAFPNGV